MRAYLIFFLLFAVLTYKNVMFLRIILSWVPVSPPPALRPAFSWLFDVTEPFLRIFRGMLPAMGGLDLSPLLAFVVLAIIQAVLTRI